MIPIKIQQKLTHIKNNLENYKFTTQQIDKFNRILNGVWYEMDYSIVVEKVKPVHQIPTRTCKYCQRPCWGHHCMNCVCKHKYRVSMRRNKAKK